MAKVISSGPWPAGKLAVSRDSGQNNGPTGSSRSYPPNGKVPTSADFNPQKCAGSTYGLKGVGGGK